MTDEPARRADDLATAADALLERLDQEPEPAHVAPPRRIDRVDSRQLGRWINYTAAGAVTALLVATTTFVLVIVQWSTRTRAAEAAANRAVAGVHESTCHIIMINRHKADEPTATTPLGILRAQQWEEEWRRAGCGP
ncbi:hypothetical protein MXD61_11320 [Frankia sp. AgPm24]|uniref:hypothetical protein n=1 Tax=Frankia sp. AgPm24 TaxID=631128 RepID=UPI00200DB337|nr:hypothetical protein [Frankia sp. AgPm24]MCK9922462.1 hypothetical protein [Frankia sp. AgPm24]